jgi:hypothetical protein
MLRTLRILAFFGLIMATVLLIGSTKSRAEILNDDEFGSIEIQDISVIENAADMFTPGSLRFDVPRGGALGAGSDLIIYYHGMHGRYVTLIDYSPDRKVKPLVMNQETKLTDGGLSREFRATVGDQLGQEYVLMVISNLPLSDSRIEEIAQAPDKIEIGDEIVMAAVSDFKVVEANNPPDRSIHPPTPEPIPMRDDMFLELSDFATYIDYPLNTYPYDPWPYMYLYPYARFVPTAYYKRFGMLTNTWYVFPTTQSIQSNFWDYASDGWIDNGIWIIPPGGYWQGTFRTDNPYSNYYMRILPYLIQQNTSFARLQVEINGTLVQPSIDITGAIGWGTYWTSNPFAYYSLNNILHRGNNQIRLYWPQEETDNLELQMMDILPTDTAASEIQQAQADAQAELGDETVSTSTDTEEPAVVNDQEE